MLNGAEKTRTEEKWRPLTLLDFIPAHGERDVCTIISGSGSSGGRGSKLSIGGADERTPRQKKKTTTTQQRK